jgi:hypothetical protein
MPQQNTVSVQNNFTGGLKTEFTGLNFPENAASAADNVVFDLTGNVTRRPGYDLEEEFQLPMMGQVNRAVVTYKWQNVGGDSNNNLMVVQVGQEIFFYGISRITEAEPALSKHVLSGAFLNIGSFYQGAGDPNDIEKTECQFTDGQGYLIITHPQIIPLYCQFNTANDSVSVSTINIQIRDFDGVNDMLPINNRPPGPITDLHRYNLLNQGWTDGTFGDDTSTNSMATFIGTDIQHWSNRTIHGPAYNKYPSNADVWTAFIDPDGVFQPCLDILNNNSVGATRAPNGHFILSAFNQDRNSVSGLSGLPSLSSLGNMPSTCTFYAGRVWYSGVNVQQYMETIYFSQVLESNSDAPSQFGKCYQKNDPTHKDFFDLLPTDGGVIKIQNSGYIFKLFPVQNGLLVFAANGIWFVTGSQGLGFTANDYTITKISSIQTISHTSFVNVHGWPFFWNEESIYQVAPSTQNIPYGHGSGGIVVVPLTVDTIQSLYDEIPVKSKRYARGDYNPNTFMIKWIYRKSEETTIESRYSFSGVINFNTTNKSFYTYSLTEDAGFAKLVSIDYIPSNRNTTINDFKYLTRVILDPATPQYCWSEEKDTETWTDWNSHIAHNYVSTFTAGPNLTGKAVAKFQPGYLFIFSNGNGIETAYKVQGLFDYSVNSNSGRVSSEQTVVNGADNFGIVIRRHKLRGRGMSFQLKVTSVDEQPFDIIGWSIWNNVNASV